MANYMKELRDHEIRRIIFREQQIEFCLSSRMHAENAIGNLLLADPSMLETITDAAIHKQVRGALEYERTIQTPFIPNQHGDTVSLRRRDKTQRHLDSVTPSYNDGIAWDIEDYKLLIALSAADGDTRSASFATLPGGSRRSIINQFAEPETGLIVFADKRLNVSGEYNAEDPTSPEDHASHSKVGPTWLAAGEVLDACRVLEKAMGELLVGHAQPE